MYFPYIRGRQFELLALRELIVNNLIGEKVIPIVEPVKLSPTLINTIDEFFKREKKVALVRNPAVGTFIDDWSEAEPDSKATSFITKFDSLFNADNVIKSIILQEGAGELLEIWDSANIKRNSMLAILQNRDCIDMYEKCFSQNPPEYVVTPGDRVYTRRIHSENKILLDDKFIRKERNADYSKNVDEFFSDDHLYYREEDFIGFSDYSVIGADYMEAGFAPYAVAIHLVYFDKKKNIRVHHFVSKSNEDISNPALKYYEALTEMNNWYQDNAESIFMTRGLKTFLQHYKEEVYPGLGTIKKLSLMHHLELINHFLEEN